MHKLIVEQSGPITIQGTVRDGTSKNEISPYLKVKLRNSRDEIVGRAETDENGHYIMTALTLPIGEYTLTFGEDEAIKTIDIKSNTTSLTVDTKLKEEMEEVVVTVKGRYSPIFNIKVLNSNGENIVGQKLKFIIKIRLLTIKHLWVSLRLPKMGVRYRRALT